MAGALVAVPTKSTIDFGTTGFTAQITGMGWPGITREALPTSHFLTSLPSAGNFGSMTSIPACLTDAGEFTLEIHFNPDIIAPIEEEKETITVTFPLDSNSTTSAIWVFEGFVTSYDITATLDEVMTASITVKITGEVDVTVAT